MSSRNDGDAAVPPSTKPTCAPRLTDFLLLIVAGIAIFSGASPFQSFNNNGAINKCAAVCAGEGQAIVPLPLPGLPLHNGVVFSTRPRTDMRQFRIFIVVFKQHDHVRTLVEELLMSDLTSFTFEIIVLNNFGTFSFPADDPLFEVNSNNLTVINNYARLESSFGHLARDWNTAALFGFLDLANPISDIVVGLQGDVSLFSEWATNVYTEHMTRGTLFLQSGHGDAFHSWTAEGVRRIGLWDERFTDIGLQEADMFLRAVVLEPERVRINDPYHGRTHMPPQFSVVADNGSQDRGGSKQQHRHSSLFWKVKWGDHHPAWHLIEKVNEKWMVGVTPLVPSVYMYPFFEWKLDSPVERLWYQYAVDPRGEM
jgi:hypothetical protein